MPLTPEDRSRALALASELFTPLREGHGSPPRGSPELLEQVLGFVLAHPGKAPPGVGTAEMRGLAIEASAEGLSLAVQAVWYAVQWVETWRQQGAAAVAGKVLACARSLARTTELDLVSTYVVVDAAARGLLGEDPAASLGSELEPANAPNLVLHVETAAVGAFGGLRFWLDRRAARGFTLRREGPWDSPPFQNDPGAFFAAIQREAEQLSGHPDAHRLEALGARLGDLLPAPCHEALGALVGASPAPSLLVLTAEPWVPWELVALRGLRGGWLGEQTALTTWCRGVPVSPELRLDRIGLVAPTTRDLTQTHSELTRLRELAAPSRWLAEVPATRAAWLAALVSGRFDAWHFAGHGAARASHPDASGLHLDHGEMLQAGDLHPGLFGLGHLRPFLFLNACEGAAAGWSLFDPQSVALAFLRAGAGAVVAPRWPILDRLASAFPPEFYREWFLGVPIGEALRRMRVWWQNEHPGDASALAFTGLAHPLAVVTPQAEPLIAKS